MLALDPISRLEFLKLIDRSERQLDNEIQSGSFIYWSQPLEEQRAPSKRYRRSFIGIDAVLSVLSDLYCQGDPYGFLPPIPRTGVVTALRGMQMVLPKGVDDKTAQMLIGLGIRGCSPLHVTHLVVLRKTDTSTKRDTRQVFVCLCNTRCSGFAIARLRTALPYPRSLPHLLQRSLLPLKAISLGNFP